MTHEKPDLAMVNGPQSSRQSQWKFLHRLGSQLRYVNKNGEVEHQDEEGALLRAGDEAKKVQSDTCCLKTFSDKTIGGSPEDKSTDISITKNKFISSSKLPLDNSEHKTLFRYNNSQLLVKQTLKGKEVICRDSEACPRAVGENPCQAQKLGFMTNVHSDRLQESSSDENETSERKISWPDAECYDDGITLKEWMITSCVKINKVERLLIFKLVVDLVDSAHSNGLVLQDLRPYCIMLLPSNRIKYMGSLTKVELGGGIIKCRTTNKRFLEQDRSYSLGEKQAKISENESFLCQTQSTYSCGFRMTRMNMGDSQLGGPKESMVRQGIHRSNSGCQNNSVELKNSMSETLKLEEKWYSSPEELTEGYYTFSSNIYSLGVLLFELLCNDESQEVQSAMMLNLRHRILPPKFLSENPREAGFCLWLLHPEPSSRPTARMILQSEILNGFEELKSEDYISESDDDEAELEQLRWFLISLREEKQRHASKIAEEVSSLDIDIEEAEKRRLPWMSLVQPEPEKGILQLRGKDFHPASSSDVCRSTSRSYIDEARLKRNICQLEHAYVSMRSQALLTDMANNGNAARYDEDVLKGRGILCRVENGNKMMSKNSKSVDHLASFSETLNKFTRYSCIEVRGTLKNTDLLNSANLICSLSFDRDEDYIAAAGISKKIKIFEFSTLVDDSGDIHYPIIEMSNKSKLSSVCWNNYIKNHLASTDYDGAVQLWDAGTGQGFSRYMEHQKRAWSIDFSYADPTKFASGSDDCSVKLWSINEGSSLGTIWNPASVCCVQFSPYSKHLLVFGSADYNIYGYDLRHTRMPWCTLAGHGKAISYVKFLDAETLVSASTDNTLKLWNLNKTSVSGLSSDACGLTFRGHSNKKNFVGLSVLDGYITCGSETNEVYCYYRSLPMPITSHKFGNTDPISGNEIGDNNGLFVSSVCWRQKSNMIVAANSSGSVKLLEMV